MPQGLELEMRLVFYDERNRPQTFLGSSSLKIDPNSQTLSSVATQTQAKLLVTSLLSQAAVKLLKPEEPLKPLGTSLDVDQLNAILHALQSGMLRKEQVRVADRGDRKIIQIDLIKT